MMMRFSSLFILACLLGSGCQKKVSMTPVPMPVMVVKAPAHASQAATVLKSLVASENSKELKKIVTHAQQLNEKWGTSSSWPPCEEMGREALKMLKSKSMYGISQGALMYQRGSGWGCPLPGHLADQFEKAIGDAVSGRSLSASPEQLKWVGEYLVWVAMRDNGSCVHSAMKASRASGLSFDKARAAVLKDCAPPPL